MKVSVITEQGERACMQACAQPLPARVPSSMGCALPWVWRPRAGAHAHPMCSRGWAGPPCCCRLCCCCHPPHHAPRFCCHRRRCCCRCRCHCCCCHCLGPAAPAPHAVQSAAGAGAGEGEWLRCPWLQQAPRPPPPPSPPPNLARARKKGSGVGGLGRGPARPCHPHCCWWWWLWWCCCCRCPPTQPQSAGPPAAVRTRGSGSRRERSGHSPPAVVCVTMWHVRLYNSCDVCVHARQISPLQVLCCTVLKPTLRACTSGCPPTHAPATAALGPVARRRAAAGACTTQSPLTRTSPTCPVSVRVPGLRSFF